VGERERERERERVFLSQKLWDLSFQELNYAIN